MYDAIIIGSGPAGFSVALNLKIHNREFVWFGRKDMSDKLLKAHEINNYPGMPAVSGKEMFASFDAHRIQMGIDITEKTVTNIMPAGEYYMVLADNEVYEAKTLALCTGVMNARLFAGEEEFLGRGVSYCATCDGNFYKGKKIAVYCNDIRYEHEVQFLMELAKEVLFFPDYVNPAVSGENMTVSNDKIVSIEGNMKADHIVLKSGESEPVDGIFILRNAIAPTTLLKNLKMENGHIAVNRSQETNFAGCFAAGDCTGRPYQYAKAVGEGNVAAHAMLERLA